MSGQQQVSRRSGQETEDVVDMPEDSACAENLKGELDELLDELGSVLEENAAEFVRNYVQKGGQ